MNKDEIKRVLAIRLQELREANGETQQALADMLGVDRQVVKTWETATRNIKAPDLIALADHYHCSVDYLLGLSDVASPDATIQAIGKYTGLNDKALENIHCEALGQISNDALNAVLGQDFETYHRLIWTITQALKFSEIVKQTPRIFRPSLNALADDEKSAFCACLGKLEGTYLEPCEARNYYSAQAAYIFREMIDSAASNPIFADDLDGDE